MEVPVRRTLILAYQVVFLAFTFGGVVFRNATVVLDFGDLMILGMAFPNIAGVLLAPVVKAELDRYLEKLAAGEFPATEFGSFEAPENGFEWIAVGAGSH